MLTKQKAAVGGDEKSTPTTAAQANDSTPENEKTPLKRLKGAVNETMSIKEEVIGYVSAEQTEGSKETSGRS